VLLAVTGCASNGLIRGTVRVPRSVPAPVRKANVASRPSPADAIVYLENVPRKVDAALSHGAKVPTIEQTEHRFVPYVLPVVAGSTVRFENRDHVYHNVFSVTPNKPFDVGKYAPGKVKEVRFDSTGVVQVFCDIDPSMSAYVIVLPHRVFVKPDPSGAFVLPQLPRGTYILKVWHPSFGRLSRRVEMPKTGDAVVELRY